jgi:hypothetical protein
MPKMKEHVFYAELIMERLCGLCKRVSSDHFATAGGRAVSPSGGYFLWLPHYSPLFVELVL